MAITFSIDNDRTLAGTQELALDESFGIQSDGDPNGVIDYDVSATYSGSGGTLSSAALDAAFLTYINGLIFADAAARDAALGFVADNGAASSISDFVTITPTAKETITNLFFSLDPDYADENGAIIGMKTLDGQALYFHIDPGNSDRALVTTSDTAGDGRIVAAFYLDENTTDHLTAQVQMVTFEAILHPDSTNPDDAVTFTDLLQISAAGSVSFDFDELPSGNFLWVALGTSDAGLLVTGHDLNVDTRETIGGKLNGKYGEIITGGKTDPSDTVNASQGGDGATIGVNSQHFVRGAKTGNTYADGSVATFTLVEGFSALNSQAAATGTNIQGIDYGNYINTVGAGVYVSQLTGTHADMKISLFNADLDGDATNDYQVEEGFDYLGDPSNDAHLIDDHKVNVVSVTLTRAGVPVVFTGSGGSDGGTGVTVVISGNEITITGAHALDTISWSVGGADTFNRFTIQALGTTDAFDIGRVDIAQGIVESHGLGSHIWVDDAGPSVISTLLVQVDEDDMTGASGGDLSTGITDGDQVGDEVLISDAALAGIVNSGTDKPGLFGLDLDGSLQDVAVLGVDGKSVYSHGDQVRYNINGSVIEGVAGERVVFTLTRVDDEGTNTHGWIFDLRDQIDHANASGDGGYRDLNLAPAFTFTDSDLDPAALGSAIQVRVENDVPELSGTLASVRVEEDELPGNTDGDAFTDTATFTKAALEAVVTNGADEPVLVALVSSFAPNTVVRDITGNPMTSKGEAMTWAVSGGVVSAVAGGRTVFTITPDGADFDVDLNDQIDHANASGDNGSVTLDVTPAFVITDYDGDAVDMNGPNDDKHPIRLVIENDMPVITSQISDGIVSGNEVDSQVTKSLNGSVGGDDNTSTNLTAGGVKTYTFDTWSTPTNYWTTLTAVPSADKTTINYYESALAGAALVYSIELDQSGTGSYTFTVHKDLPDQRLEFNFTDLPSGQNLFGVLVNHPPNADPEADGPGLLVVGADAVLDAFGAYTNTSDTINTSKGGGGVTIGVDNQMFDPGDAAAFIFLDDPDDRSIGGVGLTQTTADDADTLGFVGLHGATGGELEVVQKQGGSALVMKLSTFDLVVPDSANDGEGIVSVANPLGKGAGDVSADGRAFLENPFAGATGVSITSVSVFDRADPTNILESVEIDQTTGNVSIVDGHDSATISVTTFEVSEGVWGVIVTGFNGNDTVAYTTDGEHEAVLAQGVGGKWDLGGFNLSEGVDAPDQVFDFSVLINDYDGDTYGGTNVSFANFSIGVDGTGVFDDGLVAGVQPII